MSGRFLSVLIVVAVCQHASAQTLVESKPPTVVTKPVTPLGNEGMTVSGTVHPNGMVTSYWFEYGLTTAYGKKTSPTPLPPRLAAFYIETWDENDGGWYAGRGGPKELAHEPKGGASNGFMRFTEPSFDDHNHDNGIGTVHLAKYVYPGPWGKPAKKPSLFLGGGDPDFRDAKIAVHVRGTNWVPNGTQLQWWTQSQKNIEVLNSPTAHIANWAYTGTDLTNLLRSGKWERATYRLLNDPEQWTYAGGTRSYKYWSINECQAHLNVDCFHMVTFVDVKNPPKGSIDFDEVEIAYRNYSLLLPSNGGKLLRKPESTDDPLTLTDGWRFGAGRQWNSAVNPPGPLEFVYGFKDPVTINTVQLHQNPLSPAKDVEVLTSQDDRTYTPLLTKVLPEKGVPNSNFALTLDTGLNARARFLKVRILSGYKKEHWGLGEIEVFGTGAAMMPEDEINNVNLDITDLKPGTTYHYRLVAMNPVGTTVGTDMTYTVPADQKPIAVTGTADQVVMDGARIVGRLTPMGIDTKYHFEYGVDTTYGMKTDASAGGLQIVPRTVFADLKGLKMATTYHYRLIGTNEKGTSVGADAVFTTVGKK